MNWSEQVNIYCERLDASFWSEPLNAISNAAFIIAAIYCLNRARGGGRTDILTMLLVVILFAIGVGSFLFHTLANRWAGLADTLPIVLFILVYLFGATHRYLRASWWLAALAPVAFIGFAVGFARLWGAYLPSLNGSQGYFPVLIVLIFYGVLCARRGHPAATGLIAAAALFSASLTFRSLDQATCGALPFGTHFLWHIFNGVLLGVVLMAFVRHGAPQVAEDGARR